MFINHISHLCVLTSIFFNFDIYLMLFMPTPP